jgi:hypothetical protein
MDAPTPSYRSEFLKSPHHVVFGLLTLGLGFISADMLPLIAGATFYTLGWIYLPDMGFFRGWVDRRRNREKQAADLQKVAEFVQRRDALVSSLSPQRRERYARLSAVCRDIERAGKDQSLSSPDAATDPRLRKLDELMWTYLRLLGIEESLDRFLETEKHENVPEMLKDAEAEVARLNAEIEALKTKGTTATIETKQRYLGSRMERVEVIRKRRQRLQQAEENLALVLSEQDRLDQQIKLIRADAVATKNAETLTARIDATVEHLDQTNKWLSELDEFKDLVGDMPATETRLGYETSGAIRVAPPPVIPTAEPTRNPPRQSVRQ